MININNWLNKTDEETSAQPDLSVLKNLFNVVSSSVSDQTYMTNGQFKREISWRFVLIPLQKGKITIEPIVLGNQKTNPLEITVTDNSDSQNVSSNQAGQTPEPIYRFETQIVSPQGRKPFLQEQINYEVRLVDDGTLRLNATDIETNEDFIVKELAKPRMRKLQNGKREIVFSYALFALKSGKLKLPRVRVHGVSYQEPDIDGFFQNFFRTSVGFGIQTPVTLVSDEIQTEILPAPKEYDGKWWLPAKDVSIEARFVNLPKTIRVGTVLKREILIKATGLTGEQLPEIETFSDENFKQYPEDPRLETTISDSEVIGALRLSDVYMPQKVGVVNLPEVKIDWYDISSGEMKTAVLPREKLHIFKNANLKENKEDSKEEKINVKQITEGIKNTHEALKKDDFLPYVIFLAAFMGGMFVCYLMLKPKKEQKPLKEKEIQEKDIFSSVKKDDLKTLRDKLILWAQTNNKDKKITNLKDVANLLGDKDFENAVNDFSLALYDDTRKAPFNVKAFQKTFKKAVKNKKKEAENKHTPIPPLYS